MEKLKKFAHDKKAALILAVIFLSGLYKCPAKLLLGVDCPGCGMTRAFLSALKFDFKSAFEYHPLFILFGVETVYVIFLKEFREKFKIGKKTELAVAVISLVLLFIVWIIRQFIKK